jgi:hypothetical protein
MPPVLPVYVADWIVEVGKSCVRMVHLIDV